MFELYKKTVVITKNKDGSKLVDSTGKEVDKKTYTNFYLRLPNGYNLPIKPSFSKDYKALIVLAKTFDNEE